jgi:hypothetical protein
LALSIEYIIVTHKESQEIVFYKTAGNFDMDFLDMFRSSIQYEILDLPSQQGEIEQATLEGKFLITRAGKMIWITLINNRIPTLFTREVLKFFCEVFEVSYEHEIRDLYTKYEGDISIFREKSKSRQSIEEIIEDIFHLHLTLPFKTSSSKAKKLSPKSKKIYQFAKALIHKNKGYIYLEKLFNEANKNFKLNNEDLATIIFGLVQKDVLIPTTIDKSKHKFTIHF